MGWLATSIYRLLFIFYIFGRPLFYMPTIAEMAIIFSPLSLLLAQLIDWPVSISHANPTSRLATLVHHICR